MCIDISGFQESLTLVGGWYPSVVIPVVPGVGHDEPVRQFLGWQPGRMIEEGSCIGASDFAAFTNAQMPVLSVVGSEGQAQTMAFSS